MSGGQVADDFLHPESREKTAWGNLEANRLFSQRTALLSRRSRILEIGCGKRALLSSLLRENHDALGGDVALERLQASPECLPVVAADGNRLAFEDGSFDLVLSFDVFEHIPDSDRHLKEVRRVLRQGGHYVLQTPNIITNVPFEVLRRSVLYGVRNVM